MRQNIFEILDKEINWEKELEILEKLFRSEKYIKITKNYLGDKKLVTYEMFCDKHLHEWAYRNTFIKTADILVAIGVLGYIKKKDYPIVCILFCEFLLNMDMLVNNVKKKSKEYYEIEVNNKFIMGNVEKILERMNYTYINENDKITVVKSNADTENTVLFVDDEDIAISLLKYNDFRIKEDINAKSLLLFKMYKYFEGEKGSIKQYNNKLCVAIDTAFNNLNIRHNNEKGYELKAAYTALEKKEILILYDKLYSMMLYAFRTKEITDITNEIKQMQWT